MSNKIILNVVGMKKFKGSVDGKHYDSTRWFVEVGLSGENSRGIATSDFVCGSSAVYEQFEKVRLPAQFEFDFEMQSNGKTTKQVYVGVSLVRDKTPDAMTPTPKV